MNTKLNPVTFELPDELMAELTIRAHAKVMTLEEWVTLLVKQAMNELPAQASESQALAEIVKTLTAKETENNEGDTDLQAFEREFDAACLTPIDVIVSVDADPEVEAAWEKVADEREADIAAGRAHWIPGDEAMQQLRARLAR